MSATTQALADLGVSIWLDDLSKDRLTTGSLRSVMDNQNVVGVTSNPTIFAGAVSGSDSYFEDIARMKREGASAEDAVFSIMVADVQGACDLLTEAYESSGGVDGRVSLEVSPTLARDTEATVVQALDLAARVNRPNVMIKIPATKEGLPAITHVLASGVSVNVTLIFSLERYAQVLDAYFQGISQAQSNGHDISQIHSVASFFVSRVDTAVDAQLDLLGTPEARALRSQAAIANARLAYELFSKRHSTAEAEALVSKGMNAQRPLWASTGVKDPALPPTLYVTELAVSKSVNTMPEKTLMATADFTGNIVDLVTAHYDDAREIFRSLRAVGVSLDDVTAELEVDGVSKFVQSWNELLATVSNAMNSSE
jgi:transaldolase